MLAAAGVGSWHCASGSSAKRRLPPAAIVNQSIEGLSTSAARVSPDAHGSVTMKRLLSIAVLLAAGCQAIPVPLSQTVRSQTPTGAAGPAEGATAVEAPAAPDPAAPEPAGVAAGERTAAPESPERLTLDAAIATALERNPDLVTLRQDVPVNRAALQAARVYPYNPSVTVGVDPLAEEAGGHQASVKNAVVLTQTFELAHQTRHRVRAAAADVSRAESSVLESEVQNVAETERRFFAALYERQLFEDTRSLAELDEKLLEVLKRRFQAGQATAADVALARIEARSARQQAQLAEVALQEALRALRRHLGLEEKAGTEPVGRLDQWRWVPARAALAAASGNPPAQDAAQGEEGPDAGDASQHDAEDASYGSAALESLVARRPDVQAALAELRAAGAQWSLARASRVPNLTFGPTYERDESRTLFVGLEVQMDVPVVNTGREVVWQRQAEFRRKQVALEQLRVKARLEIQSALERYERARATVEEFRRQAGDGLDGEVGQITDLFVAGETDLLTVYAARGKVLQARKSYLDALGELAQATADLTAATAIPYDDLLALNPQTPRE